MRVTSEAATPQYDRYCSAIISSRRYCIFFATLGAAHEAQTMDQQQQTERATQNPLIDAPKGSEKPARRKKNAKSTRKAQQDPQAPAAAHEPKTKASDPAEDIVTAPLPAVSNATEQAAGVVGPGFIADPEPVPHAAGFLCKFTLSRPGLVGLNRLAIYLNDLQDAASISGWQARGWEDSTTKVRALIGFATHAEAITAIKSVR